VYTDRDDFTGMYGCLWPFSLMFKYKNKWKKK